MSPVPPADGEPARPERERPDSTRSDAEAPDVTTSSVARPGSRRSLSRRVSIVAGVLATALVAVGLVIAVTHPVHDPEPPAPLPSAGQMRAYPSFGADSIYTLDVSQAPVDPNSARMVRHLVGQITPHYSGIAALNIADYSASLYVVDSNTPRQTVEFYDCQEKGYTPQGLFDGPAHFVDVPIPSGTRVSSGTDKALTLWSPSTDQLWEFWVMEKQGSAWRACWGGRIDDVSQSPGQFEYPFGATATGIPMVGTMLRVQDVASGRADHALGLALLSPADAGRVRYPANRSDGSDRSPDAIPEGARLRLDPSLDVESLGLTPVGVIVARAAQKYGFIVVDRAGAVAVIGESGVPEQQATGHNPWDVLLGETPTYQQLENFPWDKVQVLRSDVGVPPGGDPRSVETTSPAG